jgi:hypothetical protein
MTEVSTGDKAITHTMHHLKVELIVCLDRNEPHVLSVHRFGDGFRIQKAVLVRLHEWLHELSRDQLHVVALFSQSTTEEVSARTSLHTDQAGLQVGGK